MARYFETEADCNKCENLKATKDGCKIYGDDVKVAPYECMKDHLKHYRDFTKK